MCSGSGNVFSCCKRECRVSAVRSNPQTLCQGVVHFASRATRIAKLCAICHQMSDQLKSTRLAKSSAMCFFTVGCKRCRPMRDSDPALQGYPFLREHICPVLRTIVSGHGTGSMACLQCLQCPDDALDPECVDLHRPVQLGDMNSGQECYSMGVTRRRSPRRSNMCRVPCLCGPARDTAKALNQT